MILSITVYIESCCLFRTVLTYPEQINSFAAVTLFRPIPTNRNAMNGTFLKAFNLRFHFMYHPWRAV